MPTLTDSKANVNFWHLPTSILILIAHIQFQYIWIYFNLKSDGFETALFFGMHVKLIANQQSFTSSYFFIFINWNIDRYFNMVISSSLLMTLHSIYAHFDMILNY